MRKDTQNYHKRQKLVLDEKDRTILNILVKNARAPISYVAEQGQMLRDSVKYRIKKMEQAFLIYDYHVIINPKVLGFEYFSHIFIKLEPLSDDELKEYLDKLISMKNVTHVTKLMGPYDLVLTTASRDAEDFASVVSQIKKFDRKVIQSIETGTIIDDLKIDDFSGLI